MMTWSAFLTDDVAERTVRVRSMAVGLSAVLHATLVLAVFAELSQPSAATGDVGVDVTFESTPGVEQATAAVAVEAQLPSDQLLSEPVPADPPDKQLEPVAEPQIAMSPAESEMAPPPSIESPPEQEASTPLPPPAEARLEEALPGVESPPAVEARDFVRIKPLPQAKAQVAAVQPFAGKRVAQEPKPAAALRSEQTQRKAEEDYFWQIVRRISQYRFYSKSPESAQQGMVVTRMTIARDGRLIDVALMRSSGFPTLDQAVVETIRRASPFAPLPADLGRDQQTFIVPVNYTRER